MKYEHFYLLQYGQSPPLFPHFYFLGPFPPTSCPGSLFWRLLCFFGRWVRNKSCRFCGSPVLVKVYQSETSDPQSQIRITIKIQFNLAVYRKERNTWSTMQFRICVSRLTQDYYYYNHTVKVADVGDTQATLINVAYGVWCKTSNQNWYQPDALHYHGFVTQYRYHTGSFSRSIL